MSHFVGSSHKNGDRHNSDEPVVKKRFPRVSESPNEEIYNPISRYRLKQSPLAPTLIAPTLIYTAPSDVVTLRH